MKNMKILTTAVLCLLLSFSMGATAMAESITSPDGQLKLDFSVNVQGEPKPKKKKKPRVQDFVIHADEYCSVQEHVIINFINFIFQMSITNMYIQNPPKNIREQIYRTFDKSIIHETQQPYLEVSKEMIQTFNRQYSERVI